jgi:hypothetical protein
MIVLMLLAILLPNYVRFDPAASQRKAEVVASMDNVPYLIDDWMGVDDFDAVPPEAQQLLKPNAVFSRVFSRRGEPAVHVLVVHCGDARDMIGHYPPVCYPSTGWIETEHPKNGELALQGDRLPVRLYEFRRLGSAGTEHRIKIINAFVLPDGTMTREIDDVNGQSERLALSIQGVAQMQVITSAGMSWDEAIAAAQQLLRGMPDMFGALGLGQGAAPDA